MIPRNSIEAILKSRSSLRPQEELDWHSIQALGTRKEAAEGGCGVIGLACSEQIAGKHLLQALDQMRNRGNGKGGGIAAVGLVAEQFGVTQEILAEDYLLAIAYLDTSCRPELEAQFVHPIFEIDHVRQARHISDYRSLQGLDVRPPEVTIYFVRVKDDVYHRFVAEHGVNLSRRQVEDEIVYQNTFRLNSEFYATKAGLAEETRAFVLSHGKNLLVLKMVGYGDDVIRYYQLEDIDAHVWIGHHRYPTKGRVWHPGGAHPFIGVNEALVHNGDFANYASVGEYLAQRNIYPLFLTDTEVSVQVFDQHYRTNNYPLEYVIEALAPTTERDFAMLPAEKQRIHEMLQVTHIHGSPDGPWFFLIAQSDQQNDQPVYRLTGITDTSMLRPQVFALQQHSPGGPAIGFAASEKQAIDAALESLTGENSLFWSRADRYWNARGGSHTDGGAFMFSIHPRNGKTELVCTDKFGRRIEVDTSRKPYIERDTPVPAAMEIPRLAADELFEWVKSHLTDRGYSDLRAFLRGLEESASDDAGRRRAWQTLALLIDRRYSTGALRRSSLLALYDQSVLHIANKIATQPSPGYVASLSNRLYQAAAHPGQTMVVNGQCFEPEGPHSLALELVRLYGLGFRQFIVVRAAGQRFIGNGFGPDTQDMRIDVFGSSGDYLASGMDGMQIYVHNNAQDQLGQIMKSGKLVVYGDVGQTFGYAAKGGEAYILGNAAGRPMINAVGRPRVVINGTCLDYLAESFMAGDPYNGGGFVILNGIHLNDEGQVQELETPYPGGNLFSLASGGAIYLRDPHQLVTEDQLNGGEFSPLTDRDWALILPYLEENARLFDVPVERLLEVDGEPRSPLLVYRKISPAAVRALQAEEAWVAKH